MRPIFVGNFEYDTSQIDLERLFSKYGRVERVDMKSALEVELTRSQSGDLNAQPSKEVNVSTVRVEEDGSCTGDRSWAQRDMHNIISREPSIVVADLIERMKIQNGTLRQAGSSGHFYEQNSNPELELYFSKKLA